MKLLDGKEVDVMPVFQMYKIHVQDFDLDTTHQISQYPEGPDRALGAGYAAPSSRRDS